MHIGEAHPYVQQSSVFDAVVQNLRSVRAENGFILLVLMSELVFIELAPGG